MQCIDSVGLGIPRTNLNCLPIAETVATGNMDEIIQGRKTRRQTLMKSVKNYLKKWSLRRRYDIIYIHQEKN